MKVETTDRAIQQEYQPAFLPLVIQINLSGVLRSEEATIFTAGLITPAVVRDDLYVGMRLRMTAVVSLTANVASEICKCTVSFTGDELYTQARNSGEFQTALLCSH